MGGGRPFRFGVIGEAITTRERLLGEARRAEALGYSTLLLRDHFVPEPFGDQLAPLLALTTAAGATQTLRIGSLVLDNDYRHPVVLAKEAATLDLLSDGRFELGIGAGWLRDEYDAAGMPFDPPGVRVGRLEEALEVLKGLLSGETVTFKGEHYTVDGIAGFPAPVQRPHPPILVGAGSRRMLGIAGREADIVGILPRALPEGGISGELSERSPERIAAKVEWVRQAAQHRSREVELSMVLSVALGRDPRKAAERYAVEHGWGAAAAEAVLAMPSVVAGPAGRVVEELQHRRERYGLSYWWWPTATWRPSRPWSSTWRDGDAVTRSTVITCGRTRSGRPDGCETATGHRVDGPLPAVGAGVRSGQRRGTGIFPPERAHQDRLSRARRMTKRSRPGWWTPRATRRSSARQLSRGQSNGVMLFSCLCRSKA